MIGKVAVGKKKVLKNGENYLELNQNVNIACEKDIEMWLKQYLEKVLQLKTHLLGNKESLTIN